MLISKIIFKKLKNIIDMYFNIKNYLKNNHNHVTKQVVSFPLLITKITLKNMLLKLSSSSFLLSYGSNTAKAL